VNQITELLKVKYEIKVHKLVGKMVEVEDGLLKIMEDFVHEFCAICFCYPEIILTWFPALDCVQRCQINDV